MNKSFLFSLLFLLTLNLSAQRNLNDNEISILKLSLEKSYAIKEANNQLSIDSIRHKSIIQNFIPTLEFDAAYGYGSTTITADIPTIQLPITGINVFEGNTKYTASGSIATANLTAKALIFSGFQVKYGSKASAEKVKAKNFMLKKEKADVIKDVIETFDKIELLNKSKEVLKASLLRIGKEKQRVIKAIKNGLATPFDRDKITAAELNIASKQTEIFGNLSLLYLKLSMLSGIEYTVIQDYKFDLKPWIIEKNEKSFEDRPELKALDASINAYDFKLKMNRNAFLPKILGIASMSYYNLFNAELDTHSSAITNQPINLELDKFELFPTYFIGLGLQWEIFNGLKHSNETKITSIEKTIAQDKKSDIEEKLELFAKKVQIDFEVKNQQLLFKEQEKKVAFNNLKLAIKSYKTGLISITDRLKAESDYQNVVFNYYKLISLQRTAAIELLISTGNLDILNLSN